MTTEKSDVEVVLEWASQLPWGRTVRAHCRMDGVVGVPTVTLHDFDSEWQHIHDGVFFEGRTSFLEAFRLAREWIERQG